MVKTSSYAVMPPLNNSKASGEVVSFVSSKSILNHLTSSFINIKLPIVSIPSITSYEMPSKIAGSLRADFGKGTPCFIYRSFLGNVKIQRFHSSNSQESLESWNLFFLYPYAYSFSLTLNSFS